MFLSYHHYFTRYNYAFFWYRKKKKKKRSKTTDDTVLEQTYTRSDSSFADGPEDATGGDYTREGRAPNGTSTGHAEHRGEFDHEF